MYLGTATPYVDCAREEPNEKYASKNEAGVRRLGDLAVGAVEHIRRHLFAAMGGKAMEEDQQVLTPRKT